MSETTSCKRCNEREEVEDMEQCVWCENEICDNCAGQYGDCGCKN